MGFDGAPETKALFFCVSLVSTWDFLPGDRRVPLPNYCKDQSLPQGDCNLRFDSGGEKQRGGEISIVV